MRLQVVTALVIVAAVVIAAVAAVVNVVALRDVLKSIAIKVIERNNFMLGHFEARNNVDVIKTVSVSVLNTDKIRFKTFVHCFMIFNL